MEDNRNNTISGEIENASLRAVRSAGPVRRDVKALFRALTGNMPAAVAQALKSRKLRRAAAVLTSFLILVTVFVMYILPVSLFSGAQAVVTEASEAFMSGYFSGSGGSLMRGILGFASSLLSSLWNTLRMGSGSFYTGDDMDVVSVSDAPFRSLCAKMDATKEKYSLRSSQIIHEIETCAHAGVTEKAYADFLLMYDAGRDEFLGVVWDDSGCVGSMSDLSALQLICLHAAIRGNDLSLTSLSDYLKWLGYEGGSRCHTVRVPGGTVGVAAWEGSFLPQYLEDEKYYTGAVFEDLGVSAMDLMINVRVSPSLTGTAERRECLLDSLSGIYTAEEYASLYDALSEYRSGKSGRMTEEFFSSTEYRSVFHSRGQRNPYFADSEKQNCYASGHGGMPMPAVWQDSGYAVLPFSHSYVNLSVYEYRYSVRYAAHITVYPGSIDLLTDLSGILSGSHMDEYSAYVSEKLRKAFEVLPQ